MFDEIFGEVIYDYGYVAKKEITFWGNTQEVEVRIGAEEDEGITQFQRDTFEALMQNWEEMQHKIAEAILQYYNEEAKESYGPDDEDELSKWWRHLMQNEFFEKVGRILEQARSNAKTAVNLSMVYAYYEIGKNIIEEWENYGIL